MTRPLDDGALMAALSDALAPEPAIPGPEAIAALHRALEALGPAEEGGGPAVVVPITGPQGRSTTWAGIHRLRHPVTAAVALGILATSGVAAAGVATDHLPGPTRSVAYALGLPVTSPALASAEGTINLLRGALAANDVTRIQALTTLLRSQLAGLSAADRASIQAAAADVLRQTDSAGQGSTGGTSQGGNSSTASGATSPGPSSSGGSSNSTINGGANSAGGRPGTGTGHPSAGTSPGSLGSSNAGPGGATPGTGSPGTPPTRTGAGGGSTSTTLPRPPPTTTPTTTTTPTIPTTTSTTEPDDRGDGKGD